MSGSDAPHPHVVIYANEAWYHERPEVERVLVGVLQRRVPEGGPAGRETLAYALRCLDADFAVYAAGVDDRLVDLLDVAVEVRGRVIDLRSERGLVELWIGTITRVT